MCEVVIEASGLVNDVRSFTYAEDALVYLSQENDLPVDVILLDIRMPRMNGLEFLEAATAAFGDDFAKVVVILPTLHIDPDDRARAERFKPVRHFFTKPLTREHLEHAAETLALISATRDE
jgi:CheY-like chemotaxis protein